MIPYWIVLYEWKEGATVRMYDSHEQAKLAASTWERDMSRARNQQRRATISGPFYRDGFK